MPAGDDRCRGARAGGVGSCHWLAQRSAAACCSVRALRCRDGGREPTGSSDGASAPGPARPVGTGPDQRLLEAYQAEVISLEELAERRRTITEQHCAAIQQRDQRRRLVEQRVRAQAVLANVTAFSERICSRLKDADFSDRQAILQLIVERIIVHEDTLEIRHVIPLRDPGPVDGPTGPAMAPDIGWPADSVG